MAISQYNTFKPRRGATTIMNNGTSDQSKIVLSAGEIFVEYPDGGVGTGLSKIKIGDGTTPYYQLPYAIDTTDISGTEVRFTPDTSETAAAALAKVLAAGQELSVDVAALKKAAELINAAKQDVITGAATSIVSTDLTQNKALISDGSGKVAASTVSNTELGYVAGVTAAIQDQLDGKQATITGAATSIVSTDLTGSKVLVSDASGKVAASTVTDTELGYVAGVTAAIQTQLDGKSAVGHTHTESDITGGISVTNLKLGPNNEKISTSLLPDAALGNFVVVADQAARLALTLSDVQNGDVVKQNDTGILYFVKDQTQLGTEAAFEEFRAGTAASVNWEDIKFVPSYVTSEFVGATSAAGDKGLVPAPAANDEGKYLDADGTWKAFSNFAGTDGTTAGAQGMVPAPATTDTGKFLNANGAWTAIDIFNGANNGLVPAPTTADTGNKYLKVDGTWTTIEVFAGATSAASAAPGLVPQAAAGDEAKYLAGDGTWTAFVNATTAAAGLMSATDKDNLDTLVSEASAGVFDFGDVTA